MKSPQAPQPQPPLAPVPRASLSPRSRVVLWLLGTLAAGWVIVLAVLTATTANPATLNRVQIQKSRYLATVHVQDPATGRVTVEKEWFHGADLDEITLPELVSLELAEGQRYLVPLSDESDDTLTVTPGPQPGVPLIYPAVPDVEQQLEALLNERRVATAKDQ